MSISLVSKYIGKYLIFVLILLTKNIWVAVNSTMDTYCWLLGRFFALFFVSFGILYVVNFHYYFLSSLSAYDDMDKSSMQIQKRQDTMYEEGVE